MAHIKCRYTVPYCEAQGKELERCYNWMCDNAAECECGAYMPDDADVKRGIANPFCAHLKHNYAEFEKTVKAYEYDECFLSIRGLLLDVDFIEYLEIDGRVLIKEGFRQ